MPIWEEIIVEKLKALTEEMEKLEVLINKLLTEEPSYQFAIDSAGRLKTVIDVNPTVILTTGTSRIGYVPITDRLLAIPYTDSTSTLAANASYTGTSRDTQIDSASPFSFLRKFSAHAVSDQAGTLIVQESPDNTTWVTVKNIATSQLNNPDGSAIQVAFINHDVILRYVRVAYRNGGTAQTTFRLSSRLGCI